MAEESNLKKRVLKELRDRGIKAIATTGVSEAGTPDIIGCYMGRTLCIELKAVGKNATALQKHRLVEWSVAGAVCGVIHSMDELWALLRAAE